MKRILGILTLLLGLINCNDSDDLGLNFSWENQLSNVTTDLNDVHFINENLGIAVGEGGIVIRTTDGESWLEQTSGITSDLTDVQMLNENTGFACGLNATLIKTINGGVSWTNIPFVETIGGIYGVHFFSATSGLVITGRGKIYKTNDTGLTWQITHEDANDFYTSIHFVNNQVGFVTGGGGSSSSPSSALLKTADGGDTWIAIGPEIGMTFTAINFPSLTTGYFVGYDNTLYKTSDGGDTWLDIAPDGNTIWRDVTFVDETHGYVVGEQGRILQTGDGGTTWNNMSSTVTTSLYAVAFVNSSKGYATGAGGLILKINP